MNCLRLTADVVLKWCDVVKLQTEVKYVRVGQLAVVISYGKGRQIQTKKEGDIFPRTKKKNCDQLLMV